MPLPLFPLLVLFRLFLLPGKRKTLFGLLLLLLSRDFIEGRDRVGEPLFSFILLGFSRCPRGRGRVTSIKCLFSVLGEEMAMVLPIMSHWPRLKI